MQHDQRKLGHVAASGWNHREAFILEVLHQKYDDRIIIKSGSGERTEHCGNATSLHLPTDLNNIIAASGEGYAFPTNLDRDQPIDGTALQTQADLVRQAVAEGWTQEAFESALDAQAARTGPQPRLNHHRAAPVPPHLGGTGAPHHAVVSASDRTTATPPHVVSRPAP